MLVTFKVIPEYKSNEWIGWFGENVIKIRLNSNRKEIVSSLIKFISTDLGIKESDMKIISVKDNNTMVTIDFPDVAWELFLSIIEK